MIYKIVNVHNHSVVGWPAQKPKNVVGYLCRVDTPSSSGMVLAEVISGPCTGKILHLNNDTNRLVPFSMCPMGGDS